MPDLTAHSPLEGCAILGRVEADTATDDHRLRVDQVDGKCDCGSPSAALRRPEESPVARRSPSCAARTTSSAVPAPRSSARYRAPPATASASSGPAPIRMAAPRAPARGCSVDDEARARAAPRVDVEEARKISPRAVPGLCDRGRSDVGLDVSGSQMRERAGDVEVTPVDAARARDRSVAVDDLTDADADRRHELLVRELARRPVRRRRGAPLRPALERRGEALRPLQPTGRRIDERHGDLGRTDIDPDRVRH